MRAKWTSYERQLAVYRIQSKIADFIYEMAGEIRYADKPADLTFPIIRLLSLCKHLIELRYFWIEKGLGLKTEDRGKYPHL